MIKAEQIPKEVAASLKWMISRGEDPAWSLAAVLSAWPGATVNTHHDNMGEYNAIHLPLTQENNNGSD
jgi:hypothetical protein